MDNFIVWDFASQAWAEIGIRGDREYADYATVLKNSFPNWKAIDDIIVKDVCRSYALDFFGLLFLFIPLFGVPFVTPMPDCETVYLKNIGSLLIQRDSSGAILGDPVPIGGIKK